MSETIQPTERGRDSAGDIEGQGQSEEHQVGAVEDKQEQAQQEEVDPPRRGHRKKTRTEKDKGIQAEKNQSSSTEVELYLRKSP